MEWWPVVAWIVLLGLPWVVWIGRTLQEGPEQRHQAGQAQAATASRVLGGAAAREHSVQQHSDAGMRLLKEEKWSEAVDAFDLALDVLESRRPRRRSEGEYQDTPRQEVSILFYRGYALEQTGELEEAIADYEDCQAIYGRLHQDQQYFAAVRQAFLLAKLERRQEAEQHLRQAIAALQRAPESVSWLQIEAFKALVGLLHRANDHARAIEYAQEGARAAHRLRDAAAQAGFLRAAGDDLHALDHPEEALRSYEQSLDLYRRVGQTGSGAMVKRDIAFLYQLEGQWDKALAWLQACLVDEERDQNKQGQAQLCYDIACVHIDQGNLRDAGRLLQQSISLFRQTEDHQGIDRVGRTMMGLSILVHRRVTAHQMTFRDVERGSANTKKEGK
jgi:tetratricopeptide (TPR) repeat protein